MMKMTNHGWRIFSVSFSSDGKLLASSSDQVTVIHMINTEEVGLLTKDAGIFHGHENLISSVAFSPDGKRLASGSVDETVRVWDRVHRAGSEAL